MRMRIAGRGWQVAFASGVLATFVGCGGEPTVDPNIKVEPGKTVEESVVGRVTAKKQDAAPAQRKTRGPE